MPQRLAGYVFMNICLSKGGRRSGFDLSKFLVGTTVDTCRSVRDSLSLLRASFSFWQLLLVVLVWDDFVVAIDDLV